MSASTEKKLRQAAREAGTDKKANALKEETEKKAKEKLKWTIGIIVGVAAVALILLLSALKSPARYVDKAALTVGDKSYTTAEVNYSYGTQYSNFVNSYGSYASIFGLNTKYGINGLESQPCSMMEEGGSWKDYFMESAVEALKQRTVLGKYAEENGIELTEEDLSEIDEAYAGLDETAKGYGYSDANAFLSTNYGLGVNKEVSKAMDLESALAQKAINAYSETVEISNAEIEERYPSVNIRHILVKAEADESGVYTDEAKEAAKAKAEEIYEEWKAGDATEDSFAALAEKYSEDEGSNTNGGLYENVLQGQMVEEFDAFCFEDGRKAGDTGVVYGESAAYAGYHVMYFSGKGDPANNETGRQNLLSEKCAEWLEELASAVEVTYEDAYKFVGKN